MAEEGHPVAAARQRLDKWLFFTRLVKSRTLAQDYIRSGQIRVNGERVTSSSAQVKIGDRIEATLASRDIVVVMRDGGFRRGPSEEARRLYEDFSPPPGETKRLRPLEQALRTPGTGRPTKKERRAVDRLKSEDD
ncbi:RNA-binding S4 domain-containing protein [Rhizobium sp. PAMB 3174]